MVNNRVSITEHTKKTIVNQLWRESENSRGWKKNKI